MNGENWISVKDRQPDIEDFYIIFHKGHVEGGYYFAKYDEWDAETGHYPKVTHWMPYTDIPIPVKD